MGECCGKGDKTPLIDGLCDYLDGDSNTPLCEAFKKHMADCEHCRLVVDSLRKTIRVYRGDTEVPLPPEFQKALDDAMRRKWEAKFGKKSRS